MTLWVSYCQVGLSLFWRAVFDPTFNELLIPWKGITENEGQATAPWDIIALELRLRLGKDGMSIFVAGLSCHNIEGSWMEEQIDHGILVLLSCQTSIGSIMSVDYSSHGTLTNDE